MRQNRNRAWRRFKYCLNKRKGTGSGDMFKPEKNWKLMYMRSCKMARAKQLGFEYPRKSQRQLLDQELATYE